MKKTKFKGFTLIECLVALAILGIATMTMAQIYANVARINQTNHLVNTSLSYQMKYVEEKTASEAVPILYGNSTAKDPKKKPPHIDVKPLTNKTKNVGSNGNFFKITSSLDSSEYSCGVDIYVLMSRDADDNDSGDSDYRGKNENAYNLRYRYIVGHSN